MDNNYIKLEVFAEMHEYKPENLTTLLYKDINYNYLRFKKVGNQIYVHKEFNALFKNDLEELRQKALIIAKTENNLCKELSALSNNEFKQKALSKYFYRFKFKQIAKALKVIELLKKYINANSIFPESELAYD